MGDTIPTRAIRLTHGQRTHLAEPLVRRMPTGTLLTLCGIVSIGYSDGDTRDVDCGSCLRRARRTELYGKARQRTPKGAAHG